MERIIEQYLFDNGYDLKNVLFESNRLKQYTFVNPSGTTCVVKLWNHDEYGDATYWLSVEYGVGVILNSEANTIFRNVSDYVFNCNYPYRSAIAPRDNEISLLIIQFRCEVCAIQEPYIVELLDAGQRLAEYVRNEFGIKTIEIFKQLRSCG